MKSIFLHRAGMCLFAVLSVLPASAAISYDQSTVRLEADSSDSSLAKVVLLAGSPANKPGQHEYFAGCALLKQWLQQTPGVWPVMVRNGWPTNESIFKSARTVVIYVEGGGKQPFFEPSRWALLKQLMDAGTGLVMVHQAVDFPIGPDREVKEWLGGVWKRDIGCRGHWDMELKPLAEHPVLRGVGAFPVKGDGWLYNLHFADARVTPLLAGPVPVSSRTTADAKKHAGRDEVMAWAFERGNGGRSVGFTGCDLHRNWALPEQRRLMLNAILWTAKLPVPAGGAPAHFSAADLDKNLDDKRTKTATSVKQ
jgi:Trehalose utilisation